VQGVSWTRLDDTLRVATGAGGLIRVGERSYRGDLAIFRNAAGAMAPA